MLRARVGTLAGAKAKNPQQLGPGEGLLTCLEIGPTPTRHGVIFWVWLWFSICLIDRIPGQAGLERPCFAGPKPNNLLNPMFDLAGSHNVHRQAVTSISGRTHRQVLQQDGREEDQPGLALCGHQVPSVAAVQQAVAAAIVLCS